MSSEIQTEWVCECGRYVWESDDQPERRCTSCLRATIARLEGELRIAHLPGECCKKIAAERDELKADIVRLEGTIMLSCPSLDEAHATTARLKGDLDAVRAEMWRWKTSFINLEAELDELKGTLERILHQMAVLHRGAIDRGGTP